tara:strand:+ start:353 stop:1240 length:888 start_codon:yes stop_codon:yes gene_type:complete
MDILSNYFEDKGKSNKIYILYDQESKVKIPRSIQKYPVKETDKYYSLKKDFIIYTTGLADADLMKIYKDNNFYDDFIRYIPDRFKIKIYHYDPGFKDSNSNVFKEEFHHSKVDINKNYIILDFAHLYYHSKFENGIVTESNIYKNIGPGTEELNLNVLRFGYYGDPLPQIISKQKLIDIDSEDKITTYIDIIRKLPNFNSRNPDDFFTNIFNIVNKKIRKEEKKKYNMDNKESRKKYFNFIENILNKKLGENMSELKEILIVIIFDEIWNNKYISEDKLIILTNNKFYESLSKRN